MSDFLWYVGDTFVPSSQAVIPITDLTVTRGYGVFDFLRTYHGKPFHLKDHIRRLHHSADLVGIPMTRTEEELAELVHEALKKNNLPESHIKIMLTGGPSTDGILPIGQPMLAILVTPSIEYPAEDYEKGVKIVTYTHTRTMPEAKTFNYLHAVIAMQDAIKQDAVEVLYIDPHGMVHEPSRSNIFVIKNKKIITPMDEILPGITRNIVIDLACENDCIVEEREFNVHFLYKADEIFFTNSSHEIVPVTDVDTHVIGSGRVGPITKRIMKLFRTYTQEY